MKIVLILFTLLFTSCFINSTYTFRYSACYSVHPISYKSKIQAEEIQSGEYKIKVYRDSVKINSNVYLINSRKNIANGVESIFLEDEQKLIIFKNSFNYKVTLFYKNKLQYFRLTERLEDI